MVCCFPFLHLVMSNLIIACSALSESTLTMPILLHLVHPFVFRIVLDTLHHVKAFRMFLGSLPAGSEISQIAQALLIDAVDRSGVDFASLTSLLEETFESRQPLNRS